MTRDGEAESMHRRFRKRPWALVPFGVVATLVVTGLVAPAPQAKPIVQGKTTTLVAGIAHIGWSRPFHTDIPTEMVGFDWAGAVRGTVEVRTKGAPGWAPWKAVGGGRSGGPGTDSRESHAR